MDFCFFEFIHYSFHTIGWVNYIYGFNHDVFYQSIFYPILIENNFGEPDRFGNEQDVYVNKDGTTVTSYIAESLLVEIAVMLDIQ